MRDWERRIHIYYITCTAGAERGVFTLYFWFLGTNTGGRGFFVYILLIVYFCGGNLYLFDDIKRVGERGYIFAGNSIQESYQCGIYSRSSNKNGIVFSSNKSCISRCSFSFC